MTAKCCNDTIYGIAQGSGYHVWRYPHIKQNRPWDI